MPRLPYGRQWIGDREIKRVSDVLSSDWITQGGTVTEFEQAFAREVGAKHAVAYANGTLALAGMCQAAGLAPGNEVVTSPLTFAATANAVLYTGATPVFADIDPRTGNLNPARVAEKLGAATRAILAVDYAGQPCPYDRLRELADGRRALLLADAAHSPGGTYQGRPVGSLADMTAFSFHPVKHITTGEGGMVTTDRDDFAGRLRAYRNHGIVRDPARMTRNDGPWYYEVHSLGINARITDFQCAMGLEQLSRLKEFVARRREIAARYAAAFAKRNDLRLIEDLPGAASSYHLYVVRTIPGRSRLDRKQLYEELQRRDLGVQVHYVPVPAHPLYQERFGDLRPSLPEAFGFYETCLSLPMYPRLTDAEVDYVVRQVDEALGSHAG